MRSRDTSSASRQAAGRRSNKLEANAWPTGKAEPPPLPEAMAPTDRSTRQDRRQSTSTFVAKSRTWAMSCRAVFCRSAAAGDSSIRIPQGSGRIELADWLTDPDNPLVARVFVNRVWMHLMGEGLVRTVDNFGLQGERPTHPELLDTWRLSSCAVAGTSNRWFGRS